MEVALVSLGVAIGLVLGVLFVTSIFAVLLGNLLLGFWNSF